MHATRADGPVTPLTDHPCWLVGMAIAGLITVSTTENGSGRSAEILGRAIAAALSDIPELLLSQRRSNGSNPGDQTAGRRRIGQRRSSPSLSTSENQ